MKTLGLIGLMGVMLCGCGKPAEIKPKPSPGISGKWALHVGNAVDHLALEDRDGILSGTITKDKDYGGGRRWPIKGIHVGDNVELSYSSERADEYNTSTADLSFTGKIEKERMSGKAKVLVISSFKSGNSIPNQNEVLWIAERE